MQSERIIRERLKNLRSKLTKRAGKGLYGVFPDNLLEELVRCKPKTIQELSKIKGFPAEGKRVIGYGEAIIACINKDINDVQVVEKNGDLECIVYFKESNSF